MYWEERMRKKVHIATVYPLKRRPRLLAGRNRHVKPVPVNIHSIENYDFPAGKSYFFDTNIWLYIYGPIGWPDERLDIYSRALKRIRDSKGTIYINCMI